MIRSTARGTYQLISLNSAVGLLRPLMNARTESAIRPMDMIPGKKPLVGFMATESQKPYWPKAMEANRIPMAQVTTGTITFVGILTAFLSSNFISVLSLEMGSHSGTHLDSVLEG